MHTLDNQEQKIGNINTDLVISSDLVANISLSQLDWDDYFDQFDIDHDGIDVEDIKKILDDWVDDKLIELLDTELSSLGDIWQYGEIIIHPFIGAIIMAYFQNVKNIDQLGDNLFLNYTKISEIYEKIRDIDTLFGDLIDNSSDISFSDDEKIALKSLNKNQLVKLFFWQIDKINFWNYHISPLSWGGVAIIPNNNSDDSHRKYISFKNIRSYQTLIVRHEWIPDVKQVEEYTNIWNNNFALRSSFKETLISKETQTIKKVTKIYNTVNWKLRKIEELISSGDNETKIYSDYVYHTKTTTKWKYIQSEYDGKLSFVNNYKKIVYDFDKDKDFYLRQITDPSSKNADLDKKIFSGKDYDTEIWAKEITEFDTDKDNWDEYFSTIKETIWDDVAWLKIYLKTKGEPNVQGQQYKEFLEYAEWLLGITKNKEYIENYFNTGLQVKFNKSELDFNKLGKKITGGFMFYKMPLLKLAKEMQKLKLTIQRFPQEYHKTLWLRYLALVESGDVKGLAENSFTYGMSRLKKNGKQKTISNGLLHQLFKAVGHTMPETSMVASDDGGKIFCHEYNWHITDYLVDRNKETRCEVTWEKAEDYLWVFGYGKDDENETDIAEPWYISKYAKTSVFEDVAEISAYLTTSTYSYREIMYKSLSENGNLDESEPWVFEFKKDRINKHPNPHTDEISDEDNTRFYEYFPSDIDSDILLKKMDAVKTMLRKLSDGLMDDTYWGDVINGVIINESYRETHDRGLKEDQSFINEQTEQLMRWSSYLKSIKLYPNPLKSGDILKLEAPDFGVGEDGLKDIEEINIYDTQWKLVQQTNQTFEDGKASINIRGSLSNGIYIIKAKAVDNQWNTTYPQIGNKIVIAN